ncbi:MAG: cytochrome P450 [Alphaproteobacteria bacterium]|nr:cytochrome P450 [Alphaproteobacteria bacterium]
MMTQKPITLPKDIAETIVDPRAYASRRIHDAYAWLRANNPLGIAEPEGFDPFWVVTKHADILEVGRQNDLFHNGDRQATLTNQENDRRVREITGGSPHLIKSLVQMDAPEHPKYRALAQAWFLPSNLKKLEDRIRQIARAVVDKMAAMNGHCDFVADVALRYPLHVIMEILGVPEEDEPRMLRLTQELFGPQDPDTARVQPAAPDPVQYAKALTAVVDDFEAYFSTISEDRRAHPRGDFATVIATATIDGVPLPRLEQMGYYMIIATAGHDTTSSSTAGAVWELCDHPEEFAKLKSNPGLIPSAVEEAIRWMTPVKHFMRSATRDTELRQRQIKKGDWLMLCYASGNRDEDIFEDPFQFKVDRTPNRQIAFGYGAHLCLGQHLARMEMRILFEELLPRLKSLSRDGEATMTQAFFVNGPKSLPIRYEMQ